MSFLLSTPATSSGSWLINRLIEAGQAGFRQPINLLGKLEIPMKWKSRYLAAYQKANGRRAALVASGADRFRVEDAEGLDTGIAYTQAALEAMTVRLQQRTANH